MGDSGLIYMLAFTTFALVILFLIWQRMRVQRAKETMPAKPVRLFVAAEAHYFRGRAAYHFYPHNVYFDARNDRLPPASAMRAGDWLFVYQRPGIQFDRSQNMLRWDDGQTHAAEVKMIAPGAALFRLM